MWYLVVYCPTNSGASQSAVWRTGARCALQMCRRFKKSLYSSSTRKWSSAKNKILNCKQGSGREGTCAAIITVHGSCTSHLFNDKKEKYKDTLTATSLFFRGITLPMELSAIGEQVFAVESIIKKRLRKVSDMRV